MSARIVAGLASFPGDRVEAGFDGMFVLARDGGKYFGEIDRRNHRRGDQRANGSGRLRRSFIERIGNVPTWIFVVCHECTPENGDGHKKRTGQWDSALLRRLGYAPVVSPIAAAKLFEPSGKIRYRIVSASLVAPRLLSST